VCRSERERERERERHPTLALVQHSVTGMDVDGFMYICVKGVKCFLSYLSPRGRYQNQVRVPCSSKLEKRIRGPVACTLQNMAAFLCFANIHFLLWIPLICWALPIPRTMSRYSLLAAQRSLEGFPFVAKSSPVQLCHRQDRNRKCMGRCTTCWNLA
jgi:hypothetical protein